MGGRVLQTPVAPNIVAGADTSALLKIDVVGPISAMFAEENFHAATPGDIKRWGPSMH